MAKNNKSNDNNNEKNKLTKKLKLPQKKISEYKNINQYYKRIWILNKTLIYDRLKELQKDSNLTEKNAYRTFINAIKEINASKGGKAQLTIGALKTYEKSIYFQTKADIQAENVRKGLKSHYMWETFRSLNRHQVWNPQALVYIGNDTYIYDNRIRISF